MVDKISPDPNLQMGKDIIKELIAESIKSLDMELFIDPVYDPNSVTGGGFTVIGTMVREDGHKASQRFAHIHYYRGWNREWVVEFRGPNDPVSTGRRIELSNPNVSEEIIRILKDLKAKAAANKGGKGKKKRRKNRLKWK